MCWKAKARKIDGIVQQSTSVQILQENVKNKELKIIDGSLELPW